jgi:hypothetical protein
MKTTIKIEKEVEIKFLHVKAGVRYWEDATVNDVEDVNGDLIPCRDGNLWCPVIDIDSGQITNWTKGVVADIHYKVCDAGSYYLKDSEGNTLLSIDNDYVPSILCPSENGYGDYIIMTVNADGMIQDWDGSDLSDFLDEE